MSANAQIWFNILTIIAILAGPAAAIQVQVYLEKRRELRRRKIHVFRELMITRNLQLAPRHVEALNGIQMEFAGDEKTEKEVIDAWQLYLTNLNNREPSDAVWKERINLLHDLLHKMAIALGFTHFNKARIKNEGYIPQYFADVENEQNELRKGAVEVFGGKRPLKVEVFEPGPQPVASVPTHAPTLLVPVPPRDDKK
jgi:hypothetical protein